jgi:low affinity Fe/Cu permease
MTPPANDRRLSWRDRFNCLVDRATLALGSAWAILASVALVVVWGVTGPLFGWSDTWQLFINTTTTVITFWMVFVIQNSQNRDARAIHLKLDEIIRASEAARNEFIVAEKATEAEVEAHEAELRDLVSDAGIPGTMPGHNGRRGGGTGSPSAGSVGHPATRAGAGDPGSFPDT